MTTEPGLKLDGKNRDQLVAENAKMVRKLKEIREVVRNLETCGLAYDVDWRWLAQRWLAFRRMLPFVGTRRIRMEINGILDDTNHW